MAIINAQYTWYENESNTSNITFNNATKSTFSTHETNPKTTGINSNSIVSKFVRNGKKNPFLFFDLPNSINDLAAYTITLKGYTTIPTNELTTQNSKIRLYLRNSTLGATSSNYVQLNFSEGEAWESFSFDFDGIVIPDDVIAAGGYDVVRIGFATGDNTELTSTYYIDSMEGSTLQEQEKVVVDETKYAQWLAGSWGVTFPVFGGERLDQEVVGGYDLVSGAQEIVDELPNTGHVITNLSYFAHSHYFTLSRNSNIDIAAEIHPSMVPQSPNDEIIFDVLDNFKAADKKIILYISTSYFVRADAEVQEAWITYYTDNFDGDEYDAYEFLVKGFIEEVKDYADGYWLDTSGYLKDDGKLDDFYAMIRSVDPDASISGGGGPNYFTDENGDYLYVDTDSFDDEDDSDYKIIKYDPVDNHDENFTSGHITPLGTGAPPNSWGYEEFTIPNMIEQPWLDFDGKPMLKHGWFPIRAKWHSPRQELMFDTEQAYRFVRRITDGGAGITFATTTDGTTTLGHMMADEMEMMKVINERLSLKPIPDYILYERPAGAYLVGEEKMLSLNSIGGVINSYPESSEGSYPIYAEVTLTAIADAGYQFDGWEGYSETSNALTITMDADKTVTAVFSKIQHTLTTVTTYGAITENVNPTNGTYDYGTEVTLTAIADAGYQFDGWEGYSETSNALTITMDADKTVTAVFSKIQHTLTTVTTNGTIAVNVIPTNGTLLLMAQLL